MATSVTAGRLARRAAPGFIGWTVALGIFLLLFGVDSVATAARALATPEAGPLVVLGLVATVCWGVSLWRTLAVVGTAVRPVRAVGLFFAATFINGVTPFGQTGGDPVSAVLVERTTGARYESGLAAIISVTGVNRVVSVIVAVVAGLVYLRGARVRDIDPLTGGQSLVLLVAGTVLVVGVVGVAGVSLGPTDRTRIGSVHRIGTAVLRRLPSRVHNRVMGVRSRSRRFLQAIRRTLTDTQTAGTVVSMAVLAEVALGATLWGTLLLLGVTAPLALAVAVVPISRVGAVAPTPGGAGGVEVALAGLLVALGGVPAPIAAVTALAFRLLTFAVPTIVGGGVVALAFAEGQPTATTDD